MHPKKYFFIITNDASWKIDWNRFSMPDNSSVVLIADQLSIEKITQKKQNSFFKHIELYQGNLTALRDIVDRLKTRFVQPGDELQLISINEDDLFFCAQLREIFKLQGDRVDDVERFTNKIVMKDYLSSLDEGVPKHLLFSSREFKAGQLNYVRKVIKYLGLPVFIKPISASSSCGIVKVSSEMAFLKWCLSHANDPIEFEIDEFIEGQAYHCDSIVQGGKIIYSFVSNYLYPPGKWILEHPVGGSMFLADEDPISIKIKEFNKEVHHLLDAKGDFCSHHEMFVLPNGRIVFLEIAKRSPGCFIPDMLKAQTGLDLREIDYKLRLGLEQDLTPKRASQYHGWLYFMQREGIIESCNSLDHIKSRIEKFRQFKYPGDHMDNATDLGGVMAEFLLCHENYEQLKKDFKSFEQFQPYVLKDLPLSTRPRSGS